MTAGWRRSLRIFGRDPQRDVDAELRFHVEARIDDLVARGAASEAARAQALAEFGDLDATRERLGAIDARIAQRNRRADWWEGIAQDFRHTLRGLARSPGFTVMVVVTLALGIGANAAVFSVLDRLFFAAPQGVSHPEQVKRVIVSAQYAGRPDLGMRPVFSYPEIRSVKTSAPAGTAIAGYVDGHAPFGRDPASPKISVAYVVDDYFDVLGLHPERGRLFDAEERRPDGLTPVAVISDGLWRRAFDGRDDVLGKSLDLGPHRYTIVGVAPAGFSGVGLDASDIWLPYNAMAPWTTRKSDWYEEVNSLGTNMIARLPVGERTAALVSTATFALHHTPPMRDTSAVVTLASISGGAVPGFYDEQLMIARRLAGVAVIILLIACANAANLLLARAMSRRRETAVRLALGVSRRRLIAQVLLESLVIAGLAAVAALATAAWSAGVLRRALLPEVAWGGSVVDARLALFACAMALAAGAAAGILPALQSSRPDLTQSLRGGVRDGGRTRSRTRSTLLAIQAALSVILLTGAGLFVRSLQSVENINLGYDRQQAVFASVTTGVEDRAMYRQFMQALPALAQQLSHLPHVERVALTRNTPMWGFSFTATFLPGHDSLPVVGGSRGPIESFASPDLFAALGIPVLEGRAFTDADDAGAERVIIVDRALAKGYWPGQDAVGKCLILDAKTAPCRRVVGVVADAHVEGLIEQAQPVFYVPTAQAGSNGVGTIVLRAAPGHRSDVAAAASRAIRSALGPRAIPFVMSLDDATAGDMHRWQLGAMLFSAAGLLALLVAAVGIYSTMAYSVGQRTHEIGVRMALGARSASVARLVMGQGVRVVLAGVALGVVASLALGRLVASLLYGVTPHDPAILAFTAGVLVVVAILASLVPAWRAARVDPMETLRAE